MVSDLTGFAREGGATAVETVSGEAAAHAIWRSLQAGPPSSERAVVARVSVPIAEVAWAVDAVRATAVAHELDLHMQASVGVGTLRAVFARPGADDPTEAYLGAIRRLRALVREHLGAVTIERCPLPVKSAIDVFGDPGDSLEIMRRIKAQLDPVGILNPGRFLGRI
jgi:glycolate oxidase FAD binding subunit